jgi:hypothetical protein
VRSGVFITQTIKRTVGARIPRPMQGMKPHPSEAT